jgi:plasmid stability protein
MASLLIKNVPEELHRRLRERATRERRSVNNEVIVLIELALQAPTRATLPEPVPLRKPVDERTVLRARRAGRS